MSLSKSDKLPCKDLPTKGEPQGQEGSGRFLTSINPEYILQIAMMCDAAQEELDLHLGLVILAHDRWPVGNMNMRVLLVSNPSLAICQGYASATRTQRMWHSCGLHWMASCREFQLFFFNARLERSTLTPPMFLVCTSWQNK